MVMLTTGTANGRSESKALAVPTWTDVECCRGGVFARSSFGRPSGAGWTFLSAPGSNKPSPKEASVFDLGMPNLGEVVGVVSLAPRPDARAELELVLMIDFPFDGMPNCGTVEESILLGLFSPPKIGAISVSESPWAA